ncbi:MAG: hypothetical protein CVU56_11700 [Deltaproteobacteria bacterium HGW-Deltaproteobacteria-14]|jgi:hypothetical protein|nr:MAG: hypothetical protein CVU56_11700 [Deltaproteobacteria bacterium HGW-Deltaproteobacteria-14]
MRFLNVRTEHQLSRSAAIGELRRLGVRRPEATLNKLQQGQSVEHIMAVPDAPPTIQDIIAITGASYAAAYRWTTGRSKFPLDAFLRVVVAYGADVASAVSWAETWLGVRVNGHDTDAGGSPPLKAIATSSRPRPGMRQQG